MNIRRKHNLMALVLLILSLPTKAGEQQQSLKTTLGVDTAITKDSLAQPIVDLKQGFRDLFVQSTIGNDINTAQLNPMAISFVEDYIQKNGKTMEEMKDWGKPYFDMM